MPTEDEENEGKLVLSFTHLFGGEGKAMENKECFASLAVKCVAGRGRG